MLKPAPTLNFPPKGLINARARNAATAAQLTLEAQTAVCLVWLVLFSPRRKQGLSPN
jgi:hypothetical protein